MDFIMNRESYSLIPEDRGEDEEIQISSEKLR
jgi:hypothetical protein